VAVTGALVVAAGALLGLDATGRLPGGLVADPSSTPTRTAPLDPAPMAAPPVLDPQPADPATAPALPTATLDRLLDNPALGPGAGAVVLDVATGRPLYDRDGAVPRTPASVAKLATGAAALAALDPRSRLRTRVVAGSAPGEVVLVGAGDTTLTARPRPGDHPRRAGLAGLADSLAARLASDGATSVTLRVDDGLFSGPAVSPDWRPTYVPGGVVSPVSALSVDAGRVSPRSDVREPDPALAAGRDLARLLRKRGVAVAGEVTHGSAAADAAELAGVESPTVAELVELMLASSDNDLAESLLRLVAVAQGRPGTFADGTAAVLGVLADLGVPTQRMVLLDGSGLARGSAVPPETLGGLLVLAGDGSQPRLDGVISGLPVAGFSGTLSLRYGAGTAGEAAGLVRAKTGTLTGVSTLAGVAPVDGHPVAFVVMADRVPGSTLAARAVLDRFAAALVAPESPPDNSG
jgi:D-alanyl-D-alanine carboxypeptidase/D-alanyl-D-alanine-endopeptidase (penicillin-binding protein 4)